MSLLNNIQSFFGYQKQQCLDLDKSLQLIEQEPSLSPHSPPNPPPLSHSSSNFNQYFSSIINIPDRKVLPPNYKNSLVYDLYSILVETLDQPLQYQLGPNISFSDFEKYIG